MYLQLTSCFQGEVKEPPQNLCHDQIVLNNSLLKVNNKCTKKRCEIKFDNKKNTIDIAFSFLGPYIKYVAQLWWFSDTPSPLYGFRL